MRILLIAFVAVIVAGCSFAQAEADSTSKNSPVDFLRYVSSVAAPTMKKRCATVVEDSAGYNDRIDAWLVENKQSIERGRSFRRSKLPDAADGSYEDKRRQELASALNQLSPRELKDDCKKYLNQIGGFIM